jgi:hypothetical protein
VRIKGGVLCVIPTLFAMSTFEVELLPGEQCPYCGLSRQKDSKEWKLGDGEKSYVPLEHVRFAFVEIVHRIGKAEAARRIGIGRHAIYKILNDGSKKFVERRTAHNAVVLLKELRDSDTVYSKQSIRRGATARGEKPRRPKKRGDFYQDPGAREADRHRQVKKRQKEREEQLQQLAGY